MDYKLVDSGHGCKLESFAGYTLCRPCSQAIWLPTLNESVWQKADATFSRKEEDAWKTKRPFPKDWRVTISGVTFRLSSTDFGHLGVFPEHSYFWDLIQKKVSTRKEVSILNLFAYTGGASLAAALAGAAVCHVDASKTTVAWAKENAALNGLQNAPIRWIVDDVIKFLQREIKRGRHYDGIILDPPTFGRGAQGEIFKIERDLPIILDLCRQLLSDAPLFWVVSCHTPAITGMTLSHMLKQNLPAFEGKISSGDMVLGSSVELPSIPCGSFALWEPL